MWSQRDLNPRPLGCQPSALPLSYGPILYTLDHYSEFAPLCLARFPGAPWSIRPQLLELIEIALLFCEYMDDYRSEIQQNPALLLVALQADFAHFELTQPVFDVLGDRQHLTAGLAAANNEVIGDYEDAAHVDYGYVGRLFLCRRLSGYLYYFLRFQFMAS